MIAARRGRRNFGLQHAVDAARELRKPLLVLEPLRAGYRWANDRMHAFVLQGMADNARHFSRRCATYHPYVEPSPGSGSGLLEALAANACLVVTDDFPCFFLPRMVAAAAKRLDVRLTVVDSNGLLPLRATGKTYPTAYAFRRFLQKALPEFLPVLPEDDPLSGARLPRLDGIPDDVARRWPAASEAMLAASSEALKALPIDHAVAPAALVGGASAASRLLEAFLDDKLSRYADERNQPERDVASGLSPYLHFGHVSVHDAFARLAAREGWSPASLAAKATGERSGWWGMSVPAEAFLDELVTWREVGFNFASLRADHDRYASLPDWAKATLAAHAADPREPAYALADFEAARTHDPLWNAAQRQLVREGRIHNYLRMLWGKKILQWSASPQEAAVIMIELNNKYALDGRDPNSYSGIFWVLGRFDRPWAPERPVFGVIRYMSSENTARKVRVKEYLARFA